MDIYIDGTWNTPKDNSNIHKLYERYGGKYFKGPGTKVFFLDRIFGGAFGLGTQNIVDEALKYFKANYKGGPIRIFGFSRGAAGARMLANEICKLGYKVNFLGCFDTVGAFGIPVNILGIPFQKINLFHDMHVNKNVINAVHLTAKILKNRAFVSTPMKPRKGIISKSFNGDHTYVGSSKETFDCMVEELEKVR